jgi:crotonobetainyl-CoA:carnitine CoA-transferase CaiB-like acyl-CoA transferase
VRNFEDVVGHEQSAVREMFPTLPHPTAGPHRVTGTPIKLSETPGGPGLPAPLLGQHTRETLAELLELSAGEVDGLAARGVVYEASEASG